MTGSSRRLPIELILQVIESVIPPTAVLNHFDERTPFLLAFTLVSRSTYRTASVLLRRHCAYLENAQTIAAFLQCLDRPPFHPDLPWHAITTLHLNFNFSFTERLKPACDIRDILMRLAPTLRVLVFDIPIELFTSRQDDDGMRPSLSAVLAGLEHLEELIFPSGFSVDDRTWESFAPNIWSSFPALRRLLVTNASMTNHALWRGLAVLPHLEFLWLIGPKAYRGPEKVTRIFFEAEPPADMPSGKDLMVAVVENWVSDDEDEEEDEDEGEEAEEDDEEEEGEPVRYELDVQSGGVVGDIEMDTLRHESYVRGALWDIDVAMTGALYLPRFG